jgi:hypothetical protein
VLSFCQGTKDATLPVVDPVSDLVLVAHGRRADSVPHRELFKPEHVHKVTLAAGWRVTRCGKRVLATGKSWSVLSQRASIGGSWSSKRDQSSVARGDALIPIQLLLHPRHHGHGRCGARHRDARPVSGTLPPRSAHCSRTDSPPSLPFRPRHKGRASAPGGQRPACWDSATRRNTRVGG